jgi:hypothetical protein
LTYGDNYAAIMHDVIVNNIRRWKKCITRKSGAGRKIADLKMENDLLIWIVATRQKSRKMIRRKAI